MSADTLIEQGEGRRGDVDEEEFAAATRQHRRELHVHCYRMLGSFEDAEDAVQETFLRAWRRRDTFEARSTVRAWLYAIATNASLDLIARRRRRAAGGEVSWLQPYPDRLLDDVPAADVDGPEAVAVDRETIELAYVVAMQHLAPRPRAALILRDVLGWPAKEVAAMLGDTVISVNSALQRARSGMREHLPPARQDWSADDADALGLVQSFVDASLTGDTAALATILRDDVRASMPPTPGLYVGRAAVLDGWVADGFTELGEMRAVRTAANRQPAAGFYLWRDEAQAFLPLTADVLRVVDGAIAEVTTFHADQFERLGLPDRVDR